jgi:hypothetical protein
MQCNETAILAVGRSELELTITMKDVLDGGIRKFDSMFLQALVLRSQLTKANRPHA